MKASRYSQRQIHRVPSLYQEKHLWDIGIFFDRQFILFFSSPLSWYPSKNKSSRIFFWWHFVSDFWWNYQVILSLSTHHHQLFFHCTLHCWYFPETATIIKVLIVCFRSSGHLAPYYQILIYYLYFHLKLNLKYLFTRVFHSILRQYSKFYFSYVTLLIARMIQLTNLQESNQLLLVTSSFILYV
jgi:hypothetical protein